MNKALKKTMIIIGIAIGAIVALFLLLYAVLAVIGCAMYGEARKDREYVCVIADIGSGIAPQGITYAESVDKYIQTGYGSDGFVKMYLVSGEEYKKVNVVGADGNPIKGHAGGVTCVKNNVYVCGGSSVMVFALDEICAAGDDTPVTVKQTFPVANTAAYCFTTGDKLFVGEFYRAGNYETDKNHYYTTPNGDENKAIVSCYALGADGLVASEYPEYCISVTGLVQGFAITEKGCVLSRSYGLVNSKLEYHELPINADTTVSVKNADDNEYTDVPLYYLDSSTNYKTLTLPSFSEDVTVVNDRVVVTNEASANKYFVGKLFGAHKVYSYPMYEKE